MKFVVRTIAILLLFLSYLFIKGAIALGSEFGGEAKLLFWGLGMLFSVCGAFLFRKAKQLSQKKGKELLRSDKRSPIVYLRSFLDDPEAAVAANDSILAKFLSFGIPQNLNSEEEQLSIAANNFGPFVAIGNPNEPIPQLGASRIYADNSTWKEVVLDLIESSQLVIMRVGETPGLWWEIETVLNHVDPEKIVFLLPSKQHQYKEFKQKIELHFPINLPIEYAPVYFPNQSFSAVLIFNSKWKPTIIYCKERTSWIFSNGIANDFKEIINYILTRSEKQDADSFVNSRSQFSETPLAKLQLIGGTLFLGFLITAILSSLIEGCTNTKSIELGSPPMLIMWIAISAIWYLLILFGKRPDKEELQ